MHRPGARIIIIEAIIPTATNTRHIIIAVLAGGPTAAPAPNSAFVSFMRQAAIIFLAALFAAPAFATCGERGGPGYRGPDDQCVGWANLTRVCGSPPTTNCTAEMVAEGANGPKGKRTPSAVASGAAAGVGLLSAKTTSSANSDPIEGQASVIDADTIEIHGHRIRLSGVDAPEGNQLCRDAESNHYRCGQQSANELSALIDRRPVQCIEVDRDRYNRSVAVCTVAGIDLGDWLVRGGLALDWPRYSDGAYADAQKEAERAGKGMWAGSFAMPWDYRSCAKDRRDIEWCSDGTSVR